MKTFTAIALILFTLFTISFLTAESMGVTEDAYIQEQLETLKAQGGGIGIASAAIALLLTLDLFLPVPSSILMLLSGAFNGFLIGAAINFIGAMGSAIIGFFLCRKYGQRAFEKVIGDQDTQRVEQFFETYGIWAILLSRSVPMLTEVISCLAGLTMMPFRRFLLFTSAGTLPVSLVYAYAGSLGGSSLTGWTIPVVVALIIPAIGYILFRYFNRSAFGSSAAAEEVS